MFPSAQVQNQDINIETVFSMTDYIRYHRMDLGADDNVTIKLVSFAVNICGKFPKNTKYAENLNLPQSQTNIGDLMRASGVM